MLKRYWQINLNIIKDDNIDGLCNKFFKFTMGRWIEKDMTWLVSCDMSGWWATGLNWFILDKTWFHVSIYFVSIPLGDAKFVTQEQDKLQY